MGHQIINYKGSDAGLLFIEQMVNNNLPSSNALVPNWEEHGSERVHTTISEKPNVALGFKKRISCSVANSANSIHSFILFIIYNL